MLIIPYYVLSQTACPMGECSLSVDAQLPEQLYLYVPQKEF